MNRVVLISASLFSIVLASGCSNQQVYDNLQKRNEQQCYQLPVAQQHKCLQNVRGMPYPEYERELKKAAD